VFQDYALFPHMTALANVEFGGGGAQAQAILERLGIDSATAASPNDRRFSKTVDRFPTKGMRGLSSTDFCQQNRSLADVRLWGSNSRTYPEYRAAWGATASLGGLFHF